MNVFLVLKICSQIKLEITYVWTILDLENTKHSGVKTIRTKT